MKKLFCKIRMKINGKGYIFYSRWIITTSQMTLEYMLAKRCQKVGLVMISLCGFCASLVTLYPTEKTLNLI